MQITLLLLTTTKYRLNSW